ncbi:hypothetical protein D3C76_1143610 [compost metagenome]
MASAVRFAFLNTASSPRSATSKDMAAVLNNVSTQIAKKMDSKRSKNPPGTSTSLANSAVGYRVLAVTSTPKTPIVKKKTSKYVANGSSIPNIAALAIFWGSLINAL